MAYVSDESGRNEVYMAPFPVYDLTAAGQRFGWSSRPQSQTARQSHPKSTSS